MNEVLETNQHNKIWQIGAYLLFLNVFEHEHKRDKF